MGQFAKDPVKLSRGLELAGLDPVHLHTLHQVLARLEQSAEKAPFIPLTAFRDLDTALQGLMAKQMVWLLDDNPYSCLEGLETDDWYLMATRLSALDDPMGASGGGATLDGAMGTYRSVAPRWLPVDRRLAEDALQRLKLKSPPTRLLYTHAYDCIEQEDRRVSETWLAKLEAQRASLPHHTYELLHVERKLESTTKLARVRLTDTGQEYYWHPAKLQHFANPSARKAMICSAYDEYSGTETFPRAHFAVLGGELGVLREIAHGTEPMGMDDAELTARWPALVAMHYELGNVDLITPNLILDETGTMLRVIDPDYTLAPGLVGYTTAKLAGTHLPNSYPDDFVARRLASTEKEATAQIRARIGHWMTEEELKYLLLRRAIVRADLERRFR